jgi:ABC-type nitrate/sulfonate/bicarbonate transport system ATPase subunit
MQLTRRRFVTKVVVGIASVPFMKGLSSAQIRGKLGYMKIVDTAAMFMAVEKGFLRENLAGKIMAVNTLNNIVHLMVWELSGGMQQRVAIARALAYEPEVLLMDEPFGSLDALTRLELEDTLLKLWEELGTTILFITHDIEEAIYLSDRIWLLSRRPATILEELRIDFVRPRHQVATRGEARFMELRNEIYRRISHEGTA